MPPAIQMEKTGSGPGRRFATLAGVRKIPDPIVVPMTTATALQRPRERGRVSRDSAPVVGEVAGIIYGSVRPTARERWPVGDGHYLVARRARRVLRPDSQLVARPYSEFDTTLR